MIDEYENDGIDFSITAFLLVTGVCFLSFTMLLWFLDRIVIQSFLWIGLATFSLGLLTTLAMFTARKKGYMKSS